MTDKNYADYYEDLQVSPNADTETIERIFRLLAKRYHPDNRETGNLEKFNIVVEAHKVLSDPEKRASYDAGYEEIRKRKWQVYLTANAGEEIDGKKIRSEILLSMYMNRKEDPVEPGIGTWRLEKLLGYPEKVMEFHLWYLKEKGWIQRMDTGKFSITADGVDVVEENGLVAYRKLITDKRKFD